MASGKTLTHSLAAGLIGDPELHEDPLPDFETRPTGPTGSIPLDSRCTWAARFRRSRRAAELWRKQASSGSIGVAPRRAREPTGHAVDQA